MSYDRVNFLMISESDIHYSTLKGFKPIDILLLLVERKNAIQHKS